LTIWDIISIAICLVLLTTNFDRLEKRYENKEYRLMLFPIIWICIGLFVGISALS
jgi:hypothetical protein